MNEFINLYNDTDSVSVQTIVMSGRAHHRSELESSNQFEGLAKDADFRVQGEWIAYRIAAEKGAFENMLSGVEGEIEQLEARLKHLKEKKRSLRGKAHASSGTIKPPQKVGGTTYQAWQIFEKMWGQPRKEILAACAEADLKPAMCATYYTKYRAYRQQQSAA